MANKTIICCVCCVNRTNCVRWCCTIFWILSGVFLVLGAEFSHSAYCKQNGNLPIILPIVAAILFFIAGICCRCMCAGNNSPCCVCFKMGLSILWITAGIVCVTFAFKSVVGDCNHDILVNSLCIASSLVMLVAGCVTGDLGIQSLNRRRRYNHMRQ